MSGVGTTHHVNVGGHYYLVKPGSYAKRVAPQFGARFSTGDPDFNNMSIWQHWAQKCFVGGMDSPEWADDAMYDDGVGVDTTAHDRVTLARGLSRGAGANWGVSAAGVHAGGGFRVCVYNNNLFVLGLATAGTDLSYLWMFDPSTDGWTRITSLDGRAICGRSIGTHDGKLFIGGISNAGGPMLVYSSGNLSTWTTKANPAGVTQGVYAMRAFQRKLYVAFGTQVWRLTETQAWDGNTVFYKADQNSDSNFIVSMEVHLGFLYFLSLNGHVHRTDANTTFDIWSWDGQTYGVAIKSFDGRLFIVTHEFTATADTGWGVLYQMSGSAVTQLKRWGDDAKALKIGNMTVYDRKLWYGASNLLGTTSRIGFGMACYDPIEDAHSIVASNADGVAWPSGAAPYTNYIVDDQAFFHGKMFLFVRGHGAFYATYKYRDFANGFRGYDLSSKGASLASQNGGWLTTSTYDAGTAGVRKLWRKVVVDCAIQANTGIVVEYSTDAGLNWVLGGTFAVASGRKNLSLWLNNVSGTSLKLRFTLRSTSANFTPILYGYHVSYIPIPEANWMWSMTLVLSEHQQLLDGTITAMDTVAELAFLRDTYRTKALIAYVDADGTQWASAGQPGVLIYDIVFQLRDLTQPIEGEVQLTLLEAVETY